MVESAGIGYPRIGVKRKLKKALEAYWHNSTIEELSKLKSTALDVRRQMIEDHLKAGIDIIPLNDFSYYDQVLDTSVLFGVVPERYKQMIDGSEKSDIDTYFAMARGNDSIAPLEMTKWFDTNYHYIVPELAADQEFNLNIDKILEELKVAKQVGSGKLDRFRPIIMGPMTYLWLGKTQNPNYDRFDLLPSLMGCYIDLLGKLKGFGIEWVQLDEPILCTNISQSLKDKFELCYKDFDNPVLPRIMLATYFGGLFNNVDLIDKLAVAGLHIDLTRGYRKLQKLLDILKCNFEGRFKFQGDSKLLSLGLVDGRNVWRMNPDKCIDVIRKAVDALGEKRLQIAPSCSLLHVPIDLGLEKNIDKQIVSWLSFARQKLKELVALKHNWQNGGAEDSIICACRMAQQSRSSSKIVNNQKVWERIDALSGQDTVRSSSYGKRAKVQSDILQLPSFPTTTIGSFPQTSKIRAVRSLWAKEKISLAEYEDFISSEIESIIRFQEKSDLDVLVHGEPERNDMVQYFGEQLAGFVITSGGWIQSYGSRCVKPPVIYGDVWREKDITLKWTKFAQSLTSKPVKGMLTGPVTILRWSFVRDDQDQSTVCRQIGLAICDEVVALAKAGIRIIQVDEPAIREGLPLRKEQHQDYLRWAVECFKLATSGVEDCIQIHTHMCYSEFNDIIEEVAQLDADVVSIEASRSSMEILEAFRNFNYPGGIGPGVWDIHSPRVPEKEEIVGLLKLALLRLDSRQLWVNPDCGLKTRGWNEVKASIDNMVSAAKALRVNKS